MPTLVRTQKSHGRQEHRTYTVLELPSNFAELEQWKGLKSVAMVTREYIDGKGEVHTGTRYYISSLAAKVNPIAAAVRGHWGIENQLHWELDVAFNEDRNRARAEHAQANLGILRRTALSMLRNTEGLKGGMHCRRQQAGWSERILEKVLFGCKDGKP